jgi:hypothetical protein
MSDQGPVLELRLALTVDDYDQAFAFWHTAMGLPVSHSWGEGNGRGAVLMAGKATIELLAPEAAAGVDRAEIGRSSRVPIRVALEVADSRAAAERTGGSRRRNAWHGRRHAMGPS